MISEIEFTSRQKKGRLFLAFGLGMNLFWLAAGLAVGHSIGGSLYFAIFISALFLVGANAGILIFYSDARKVLDTLNFKVALAGEAFEQRKARYLELLDAVEMHLGNNRVSVRKTGRTGRWWGPASPDGTAFELPGLGLTLRTVSVYEDKGGITSVAFILGPVTTSNDTVARKLLEGLRQELLRSGKEAMPDRKA